MTNTALWKLRGMRSTPTRRPPVWVSVLAILLFVGGLGALASAAFEGLGIGITGLILVVFGVASLGAAIGLLPVASDGWWFAVIASAGVLAGSLGQMVLLGRISFSISSEFTHPFFRGLSLYLPIGLVLLALPILVSLVALRGHFGIRTSAPA